MVRLRAGSGRRVQGWGHVTPGTPSSPPSHPHPGMSGLPPPPYPASRPEQPPTSPSASAGPRPGKGESGRRLQALLGARRLLLPGHTLSVLPSEVPSWDLLRPPLTPSPCRSPPSSWERSGRGVACAQRSPPGGPGVCPSPRSAGLVTNFVAEGAGLAERACGWGNCSTKARGQGLGPGTRGASQLLWPAPVASAFMHPPRDPGSGWPKGLETHFSVGRTNREELGQKAWLGKEQQSS